MAKPIINAITPFDVANGTTVKFAYSGAQPYSNKITIYKASNLEVVYENTESTMKLAHTIPGGLSQLQNGTQYAAEIICYNNAGTPSSVSAKVFFWCLETAEFYFTSIEDGKTYDTSSITADVYYNQANWDDLLSYRFTLYDSTKMEIFATDELYDDENITYTFKGLDNLTSYFVKCDGISRMGVSVSTGYVQIFLNYENPTSYARLYVTPRDGNGIVDYFTNIVVIEDRSGKKYNYWNSYILLDDDILTYDYGFLIDGDFTMAIKHTYANGTIMRCANDERGFELAVIQTEDENISRYRLKVPNGTGHYILYSEPFEMTELTINICWIRRINNVYQIKYFSNEGFTEINNLFLQEERPKSRAVNYDVWIDVTDMNDYVLAEDLSIFYQEDEPESAEQDSIWYGGSI